VPVSIGADTGKWELAVCTLAHFGRPAALSGREEKRRTRVVLRILPNSSTPPLPEAKAALADCN
jgi:hypothetical protein